MKNLATPREQLQPRAHSILTRGAHRTISTRSDNSHLTLKNRFECVTMFLRIEVRFSQSPDCVSSYPDSTLSRTNTIRAPRHLVARKRPVTTGVKPFMCSHDVVSYAEVVANPGLLLIDAIGQSKLHLVRRRLPSKERGHCAQSAEQRKARAMKKSSLVQSAMVLIGLSSWKASRFDLVRGGSEYEAELVVKYKTHSR
jgi:hypothetical protein